MPSIYDELGAMAADPSTDWDTLHWIAENYPQHRAAIAGNPAAYTELLTALGSLGAPEIDAALARRAYGRAARRAPSASTPASYSAAARQAATPQAAPTTATPAGAFYSGPRSQPSSPNRPVRSAPTAQNQDHTWSSSSADETKPEDSPRGRSRRKKLLLTVLLPLLVLFAAVALAVNLLGGSGDSADQSVAESPGSGAETDTSADAESGNDAETGEEPTQQGTESAEPESEAEAEASEAPATAEELRASLEALPSASSCDSPAEDLELFSEFAAAAQDGEVVTVADGTLAQETLIGLQESCGNTHAAAIYVGLLDSGTETGTALRPSIEAMGSSWIQVSFPAQGQQLTSFASPDGNVLCELSTSLRCTVQQHSFAAPEGCTSGVTYAIEVAGAAEPDCENPVAPAAQPPLGYGQTASNAFFACSSFQSQMSCWNQLTGEGINLWADRNSTD